MKLARRLQILERLFPAPTAPPWDSAYARQGAVASLLALQWRDELAGHDRCAPDLGIPEEALFVRWQRECQTRPDERRSLVVEQALKLMTNAELFRFGYPEGTPWR